MTQDIQKLTVTWTGIRLESTPNLRENHFKKSTRTAKQRGGVHMGIGGRLANVIHRKGRPTAPFVVTITRIGAKRLDDDNVALACKAIRDGVADQLGYDDGRTDIYTWKYLQETGPYGVRVEIDSWKRERHGRGVVEQ